ncbi:uncharacterized protein AAIR98_001074 [Elusimicrobium simillimum]|uniref:YceD family protein n=1 Tax=Elusimicrobium simillimum TaxID=3143438 RepID=UPI003C6F25C3
MKYIDYDVPSDLIFRTIDIVRMKGLKCTVKLAPKDFENILNEPNYITSATVKLSFSLNQKEILVQGEVDGTLHLQCGRCLEFFDTGFHDEFIETYSTKLEIIDIMYQVVQTLALTENITFVCKDTCKGLCDMCGKNKNTEPCKCVKESYSPFAVLKDKK